MLANGIKLGYKKGVETTFTNLVGLKEVPEMGSEPEKVENTTLADTTKKYEFGIGDYGDLEYTFKYDNSSATTSYRVLRKLADDKTKVSFQEEFPDGTKFAWDAQVNIKVSGGSVNDPVDFTLAMALQSEITVTDPV